MRRDLLARRGQNPDAVQHTLHRTEIGDVDQQLFAGRSVSAGARFFRVRSVGVAVHEIVNHANLVAHAELFYRFRAQVFADAGDAVGLLDGELGNREIGRVDAYERDVG